MARIVRLAETLARAAACLLLWSATAPVIAQSATHWRCLLEGERDPEWIRIDARGDWQEWQGDRWGGSTCRGHAAYSCRQDDGVVYSETFAKDKDTGGTFRATDRLDTRSGAFHRRVLDSTFILESGTQIEKNFYGQCVAGGEPPGD